MSSEQKQRGAHVFGRIDTSNFDFLTRNNIDWVTLVPYASQEDYDSPEVRHNRRNRGNSQERDSLYVERINSIQAAGFKVFLKPHVWMHEPTNGKWRSDIFPTSDENWKKWSESYMEFILRYARIAEFSGAQMFCIGAEFTRLTLEKPEYWDRLIKEVRGIYKGRITYAANWYEEYENIGFWGELDYIGIQAYFPLVDHDSPNVQEISEGWTRHLSSIEAIHKKYRKQVVFTEVGYKSTVDAATEPWVWIDYGNDYTVPASYETQSNSYRAFFEKVWPQNWFQGAHIWQLRGDLSERRSPNTDYDFTPLGKEAEQVIREGYGRE